MEDDWLAWSKRIYALASTGVFFGAHEFDKERYQEIADIAQSMMAALGDVPLSRVVELFPDHGSGYVTPKIDVRGAVIRDDQILLVQEKSDGLWTLPGGYADVGYSAAENIVKEISEEAGLEVRATKLYAVFHKAKHEYRADARDFYKFYFLTEEVQDQMPQAGHEVSAADFFSLDALPPLSTGRVIEQHIALAFDFHRDPNQAPRFD